MTDVYPWVPDTNCETHEWRNPLGEVIRFVTRTEAKARMMPPVKIDTVKVPQAQGARFQGARHDERIVTLPVVFPGPTAGRDELRRWARALDPLKGEGTLTVVQGAFAGRQLTCVYEAGLDDLTEEYPLLGLGALMFRAADPYWSDSIEHATVATLDLTHHWFPFLPLILGPSDIFSRPTLVNPGDVDAWPVVTVTGPGENLRITNETTGQFWAFSQPFNLGDTLVVDHRPGHKSARFNGDTNVFGALSPDSSLWGLVTGPNALAIEFDNPGGNSQVAFTWRSRWLAA